jgi:hypothetical protein
MAEYLPTLRLDFSDTYNEYRIMNGEVQFRPKTSEWRTLDADDVRMHFVLSTPVAVWLRSNSESTRQVNV